MSIELMAKCARCGGPAPFCESGPNEDTVPGIRFCEFNRDGDVVDDMQGSLALCMECFDKAWTLIFGDGEEDGE